MIHFRIRDYASVLLYRWFFAPFFRSFGRRVRIVWPLRIIGTRCMALESNVMLQYGAYVAIVPSDPNVTPLLTIGSGTMIGNYSHIICSRRIDIGSKVLIADRVYIADNLHEYQDVNCPVMDQPLRQLKDVSIGAGSWIGENVCIIGCAIGRNSIIGANSVVTRDIPDYCVAAGSPAVPIKRFCTDSGTWRRTDAAGQFTE